MPQSMSTDTNKNPYTCRQCTLAWAAATAAPPLYHLMSKQSTSNPRTCRECTLAWALATATPSGSAPPNGVAPGFPLSAACCCCCCCCCWSTAAKGLAIRSHSMGNCAHRPPPKRLHSARSTAAAPERATAAACAQEQG
eukprot:1161591-Pelagomonas_calceolata.AAC.8